MGRHSIIDLAMMCCAVALAMLLAPDSGGQELPPEILVDRLLIQAERETASGEPWSAVITLERVLAVHNEHGLEIPTEFWFRQAGVFQGAGLHERAVEAATRYLREAGQEGERYRAALKILDAAEVDLAEAKRAEARARAAAERASREAAARREAVVASAPEMVLIQAGTFRMGCVSGRRCDSDERPVHEVHVPSFAMSKYEVTFDQWDACVEYGGCRWVKDREWGRETRTVIHVTWHDAQAYVEWLSRETGEAYRLPSEAEWEYAARAGTETMYSWGDRSEPNRANCDGCRCFHCSQSTSTVGTFPANSFGLHDMHGNVEEWVQDCWNGSYLGVPTDGTAWNSGDCSMRVVRGGSWAHKTEHVRAATRRGIDPSREYSNFGFRIARTIAP